MVNFYHTLRHIILFPLVIIVVMLIFVDCQKERSEPEPLPYPFNKLPLPTQTGENTFGCLINGEPWVAYAPLHLFGKLRTTYDEAHYGSDYNQRLLIGSNRIITSYDWNKDSISNGFGMNISPILGVGYYDIHNLETFMMDFISSKPQPTKIYELDTLVPFHIHITKLDTAKKIVSGTFEMDMRRISDSLDVLQIRHGRFDAWYQEQ